MDAIRSRGLQLAARAVLTVRAAWVLWLAPASVAGLCVMLVGLISAVSGLVPGHFVPDAVDALSERFHGMATRRAS